MPSGMPDVQEKGFRSRVFGFNKNDVLAYMNALANEAQQNELAYQDQIHKLEIQIEKLKKDQANARACVEKLQEEFADATDRADRAEKQATEQARQRLLAEERLGSYRTQCGDRDTAIHLLEQEKEKLQKQVDALMERQNQDKAEREAERAAAEQQMDEAQRTLHTAQETAQTAEEQLRAAREQARAALEDAQAARAEAQAAREQAKTALAEKAALEQKLAECQAAPKPAPARAAAPRYETRTEEEARIRARKILEDARLYAESAQAAMEQEAEDQKARMAENARGIAAGVLLLRERLTRVDEKLSAASLDLENATAAIYRALDDTMSDLDGMEQRMRGYDDGPAEGPDGADGAGGAEKPANGRQTPPGTAVPAPQTSPDDALPRGVPAVLPRQADPAAEEGLAPQAAVSAPAPAAYAAPAPAAEPLPAAAPEAPARPASTLRPLRPQGAAHTGATLRPKPAARPVVQAKRLRRNNHSHRSVTQSLQDALNRMDEDR